MKKNTSRRILDNIVGDPSKIHCPVDRRGGRFLDCTSKRRSSTGMCKLQSCKLIVHLPFLHTNSGTWTLDILPNNKNSVEYVAWLQCEHKKAMKNLFHQSSPISPIHERISRGVLDCGDTRLLWVEMSVDVLNAYTIEKTHCLEEILL